MYKILIALIFVHLVGAQSKSGSFGRQENLKNQVGIQPKTDEVESSKKKLSLNDARHFLARTHFTINLDDVNELSKMTRIQAVQWLFHQENFSGFPGEPEWMKGYQYLRDHNIEENRNAPMNGGDKLTIQDIDMVLGDLKNVEDIRFRRSMKRLLEKVEEPNAKSKMRVLRNLLFKDLQNWWFKQILNTRAPIVERMTLFWHGHFTTEYKKVKNLDWILEQNNLFRGHALGSFRDLLMEASQGPAMLRYLDGAKNRKNKPNENFAREVMELFTLGEGSGYTEEDIKEAARAFSGWTIKDGKFFFNRKRHDNGRKTILGKTGQWDGVDVLNMLLENKQTAQNIALKLWQYFAGYHQLIPEDLLQSVTKKFYESDYQIKEALEAILISDAFYDSRAKVIKSPIELAAGAVLDLSIDADYYYSLIQDSALLGQNLFNPPNVKGWPGGEYWINSASYLARKSLLSRLVRINEIKKGGKKKRSKKRIKPGDSKVAMLESRSSAKDQNYIFDNNQWLAQFKSEEEAILKMLPLTDHHPLKGTDKSQWVIELLLDPSYQLR